MQNKKKKEKKKFTILGMSIWRVLAYFIIYSILGYLIETLFGLVTKGVIESRQSFLYGPFCAIYGLGAVIMIGLLQYFKKNNFTLFFGGFLIGSVVEYLVSLFGEMMLHVKWWDYSNMPLNINGRICLETIIPFGLLGCFIIYISNPFFINLINKMNKNTINIIAIVLLVIFITDFIISFFIISRLRKTAKEVNEKNSGDNTEEITKKVKEILTNKSILDRRLINAFPKINIDKIKARIKENTDKVKETASKVKEEAAEKIKESAEKVKETTAKVKDETVQKFKRRNNEK